MTKNKVFSKELGIKSKGENRLNWHAVNDADIPLSSGVYFYAIRTKENYQVKKLVLLN